ncbi:MAG TPA: penicillin-binding protein 2 [bacterium]|nr:penicillin-binding protein 2 [bacterium]
MRMRRRKTETSQFVKRQRFVEACLIIISVAIIARLFSLQIVFYQKYVALADKTQYIKKTISVQRGTIYDRNGSVLAMDVPTKTLYMDTKNIDDVSQTAKALASILKIPARDIEIKLTQQRYPLIKRKLSIAEYSAIEKEKIKGVVFEDDYQRIYPKGHLASHVIGFVNIDGVGLEGVELSYNDVLSGETGIVEILRDGRGRYLSSLGKIISKPSKGKDIYLTIDEHVQEIVEEEIERCWELTRPKKISVIVMCPKTGEILAMANKPYYDPNEPGKYPVEYRKNPCITDMFEPGSIFKIITAASAIEEKKVRPDDIFNCERGKWYIRGHILHDSHPYNSLNFEDVIIKSSNIGTVKIAMRIGENTLYNYIKKFHFGEPTGIDLLGEIRGIVRPVDKWSDYSITAIPIGQEVGITCLQAVRAMAVFANGGQLVQPHVVKKIEPPVPSHPIVFSNSDPILSYETVSIINTILSKVVGEEGTATKAHIAGYKICGKTGTAQKVENGRYSHTKFVASFLGFLPLSDPRVVILVNIDEPKGAYYAGTVAAPVFREIAWRTMQYMHIPPETNSIILTRLENNEDKRAD